MTGHSTRDCVVTCWTTLAIVANAQPVSSTRDVAARLVVQVQRADYEGDRAALMRVYRELAVFVDDKELGAKVRYWRGFAVWRRALNGFNESVDRSELERDLTLAVSEFQEAVLKDPSFADAKAAAASCLLNILFLHQDDRARVRELLQKALPLLKEAETAEPENPRVLWVLGASRWHAPAEAGGGQAQAIGVYERALKVARTHTPRSTDVFSPSWGEPELLMNLAWSQLNRSEPDLVAAERCAKAALERVPYWHYVRDILLPQIRAARRHRSRSP